MNLTDLYVQIMQQIADNYKQNNHGWRGVYPDHYYDDGNFAQALDPNYDHYINGHKVTPLYTAMKATAQLIGNMYLDKLLYDKKGSPFRLRAQEQPLDQQTALRIN